MVLRLNMQCNLIAFEINLLLITSCSWLHWVGLRVNEPKSGSEMTWDLKFPGIPLILSINLLNNAPTGMFEGGWESFNEFRIPKSGVKLELDVDVPLVDIWWTFLNKDRYF